MERNEELLAKAKEAKTPEELTALAKENSVELTEEEARAYFEQLHPKTGELSDDELDNVAGGACHAKDGRLVVACTHLCNNYRCRSCGGKVGRGQHNSNRCVRCDGMARCATCSLCTYEKGLWLCNHPEYRR